MNFVNVPCVELEKPKNGERGKFYMMINFDLIFWYAESEDILDGEATCFVKFGSGGFMFLSTMPIQEFETHLKQ